MQSIIDYLSGDYAFLICAVVIVTLAVKGIAYTWHARDSSVKDPEDPIYKLPLVPRYTEFPIFGKLVYAKNQKTLVVPGKDVMRSRVLGQDFVVVSSPDLTAKAFRAEGRLISNNAPLPAGPWIFGDESLAVYYGAQHKKLRSYLNPCFQRSAVRVEARKIVNIVDRFLNTWVADGEFSSYGLRDLCFDTGVSFVGLEPTEMSKERRMKVSWGVSKIVAGLISIPIDLGLYSTFGRAMIGRRTLEELLREVITERKNNAKSTEEREKDVLQRLIDCRDENGEELSYLSVQNNMISFVVASFDNVNAAILAVYMHLCRNPHIQEKCREIIDSVISPDQDPASITMDQWDELTYIDQVVQEAMRLDPPTIIAASRVALKDFQLGDHLIKKGTILLAENWSRSQNPKYWTNPTKFDPDRFGPERNEHKKVSLQAMPFGAGSRSCIGIRYATLELKIMTTLLTRDYKVSFASADEVPEITYDVRMRLKAPFRMKLERCKR